MASIVNQKLSMHSYLFGTHLAPGESECQRHRGRTRGNQIGILAGAPSIRHDGRRLNWNFETRSITKNLAFRFVCRDVYLSGGLLKSIKRHFPLYLILKRQREGETKALVTFLLKEKSETTPTPQELQFRYKFTTYQQQFLNACFI